MPDRFPLLSHPIPSSSQSEPEPEPNQDPKQETPRTKEENSKEREVNDENKKGKKNQTHPPPPPPPFPPRTIPIPPLPLNLLPHPLRPIPPPLHPDALFPLQHFPFTPSTLYPIPTAILFPVCRFRDAGAGVRGEDGLGFGWERWGWVVVVVVQQGGGGEAAGEARVRGWGDCVIQGVREGVGRLGGGVVVVFGDVDE